MKLILRILNGNVASDSEWKRMSGVHPYSFLLVAACGVDYAKLKVLLSYSRH
ncbi:MAG: hypothetical protein IJ693_04925 [Bacteroidaceae bacterium]|nr:hypothetical protein [Bacteroidaceae bacterium]